MTVVSGEVLLVVLAPVTAKHSCRMFVFVEDFTINGPNDTVKQKKIVKIGCDGQI